MNEEIFITNSVSQTQDIAEKIALQLKPGIFLAFYGDLGSGKTTFIQGLARGLGIKRRIISPTFIIVRSYEIPIANFYHIDLYRTQTEEDLLGLGIDQIISDKDSIVALEWAEKMGKLLPQKRIEVNFEYMSENNRKITIKYYE